jgi:CheY-like chemotaxis protein
MLSRAGPLSAPERQPEDLVMKAHRPKIGPRRSRRPAPIRTLVVDDSPVAQEMMVEFLAHHPRFDHVGTAASGRRAMVLAAKTHPHLVLLDLMLPDMSGWEVISCLKAGPHPPRVIVVTVADSLQHRRTALAKGADGFVTKIQLGRDLAPLLRSLPFGKKKRPAKSRALTARRRLAGHVGRAQSIQ